MSVLSCEYLLRTYCLNRQFLRCGKRKSLMSKAILPNSAKGTSGNILECLYNINTMFNRIIYYELSVLFNLQNYYIYDIITDMISINDGDYGILCATIFLGGYVSNETISNYFHVLGRDMFYCALLYRKESNLYYLNNGACVFYRLTCFRIKHKR